ncbi:MAG: NAD-dependent epimerase/dehydratase family protein [Bacillota bacterium]|nr:NAD-dependent epimerase/dehydratase family protein [Bacillota bacterium]HPZ22461.1 NAD-dependent epimerase/dehydratase family protein [Bacillota bacterium]HQD20329.1 NAD-dependent epimerase/dehydratase family protein [Bacillota bacterium]
MLKDTNLGDLEGTTWLISGGGGFIGSYFLDLLSVCNERVFRRPCRVLCIDNFRTGLAARVRHLADKEHFHFLQADITKPVTILGDVHYIIHAAGIASPPIYRQFPLETIAVNVTGLNNLLELALTKDIKSFLFFSSSEIYGDPSPENIPTPEDYKGNVSCTGPRACYDESKRLGETLAVSYFRQYRLPVKIVRPFNIYGPGLHPEDRRVLPDFSRGALLEKKIRLFSDGTPTRSFCYIRDGLAGFLAVLISDYNGEAFNIGNDQEISMLELARLVAEMVGGVEIEFQQSPEGDYLTDNPRRRCPDLTKARTLLGYRPQVSLEAGLRRMLAWYRDIYPGGVRA